MKIRRRTESDERGAALIMVMLFAALMMILIMTMLHTTSNEIIIAGLYRDSIRAFEHAEAGIAEGMVRIAAGRQYRIPFAGSIAPNVAVRVVQRLAGASGAYMEIQSDATVGRARRRISRIVLARSEGLLPNIVLGQELSEGGNKAAILSGDAYSQTFTEYMDSESVKRLSYAGWFIRRTAPAPKVGPCYIPGQAGCPSNWWPGHRRGRYGNLDFGSSDPRRPDTALAFPCTAPGPIGSQTIASDGPGYQAGDERADMPPGNSATAASTSLYGCDADLLPYTYVREVVRVGMSLKPLWFKTIAYEPWFAKYWVFCVAPGNPEGCGPDDFLVYRKTPELKAAPQYGAVPPPPPFESISGSYDTLVEGSPSGQIDFGCKTPEMTCAGGADPKVVLIRGDFVLNPSKVAATDRCPVGVAACGHGTILVDGNLKFNGDFTYWGTLIVRGIVEFASGNVVIYGGMVAEGTARVAGSAEIYAGTSVPGALVGPAIVTGKAWWER